MPIDADKKSTQARLRLQAWLSPGFPVGGFSYSHGLERAAEAGWVADRASLVDWLDADLRFGSLRSDAILFAAAFRAAAADDRDGLRTVAELAAALRGSAELALENESQGRAFLATVVHAWPHPKLDEFAAAFMDWGVPPAYPVAIAGAAALHGATLRPALELYLQATLSNLVSAALRLVALGQTDGQRALAALEEAILAVADETAGAGIEDVGSAALMVEVATMQHETQYTRLFRS